VGVNGPADPLSEALSLSDVKEAVELYQTNMTAGKVLLVADRKNVPLE
jgi:hypothetical protein